MKSYTQQFAPVILVTAIFAASDKAEAVEGGSGAYFLGTRDTLAGIVPPPGTYLSFIYDNLSGNVEGLSVGGLPIRADADVDLNLIRLGWTQSLDDRLWGGQPAFNVTIPIPDISLSYTAVSPPIEGAKVDDDTSGIGDLSVTGLLGCTVLEADSAEAALKTLEDDDLSVDVFVTDVVMPGMDGPSWVRKALEDRPDVRVVFVSGYAEDSFGEAQTRIPNSVFLPKPFSLNDLTETVHQQLH